MGEQKPNPRGNARGQEKNGFGDATVPFFRWPVFEDYFFASGNDLSKSAYYAFAGQSMAASKPLKIECQSTLCHLLLPKTIAFAPYSQNRPSYGDKVHNPSALKRVLKIWFRFCLVRHL